MMKKPSMQWDVCLSFTMIPGKTTLLKSKAVSLARSGESVSYIVMGGSRKTESVMSIATRLDFAQYHSEIKVISQQELTKFYWSFHHPALKRQDRLGKEPFAGFGTVVEDITESGYTKNQPILLGAF